MTKRIPATVLAVATASALVLTPVMPGSPVSPLALAQEQADPAAAPTAANNSNIITKTVNTGTPVATAWGGGNDTSLSDFGNIAVSYPEMVEAGETFEVTIQPGQMTTGSEPIGRIKYDIALPDGVTIIGMNASGGSGFGTIGNSSTTNYSVIRVDANGNPSPNGQFARITGSNHQTVNNGPSSNNNDPKAGLSVPKNRTFQLPQVTFTVIAPTEPRDIIFGLRGAGNPAGPKSDANVENTMSYAEDGWFRNDAIFVNAGAAARELVKVNVTRTDIVSQITLNSATLASEAVDENGMLTVNVEARATRQKDDTSLPAGATVQFQSRTAGGEWVNAGEPVALDARYARTSVTVPDVDGQISFRAVLNEYTAQDGYRVLSSESNEKSVEIKADNTTAIVLGDIPASVEPGVEVPLEATYSVEGRPLPQDAKVVVTFKANDKKIGEAEADDEGKATLTHTFEAESAEPVQITAEVAEIVDANSGNRSWPAAKSEPKSITVKTNQRESTTEITSVEADGASSVYRNITARVTVAEDKSLGEDAKVEFWVFNEDFPEGLNLGEGDSKGDGTFTIRSPFLGKRTRQRHCRRCPHHRLRQVQDRMG